MITVSRRSTASPQDIWAILSDGWQYASWVVGASRIRAAQGAWPATGSRIFHSVGSWPLMLSDDTEVIDSIPGRLIRLKARTRPFGQAVVEVEVTPQEQGSRIEIREDAAEGPARFIPQPVRQAMIAPRNTESVKRLALLAERKQEPIGDAATED